MQYIFVAIILAVLCISSFSCRKGPFAPIGAMCYSIAVTPERTDYVCPACGNKTLYVLEESDDPKVTQQSAKVVMIAQQLESCRRLAQQIEKYDIQLDESQFCKVCHPEIEHPQLGLIVKYPGTAQPHRVWGVTMIDLTLIKAYADGQLNAADTDEGTLLRLEELLGTSILNPKRLSRQDIQKQLAVIAETPSPQWSVPNAMCYAGHSILARIDYVCPTCGEKTLYSILSEVDPNDISPLLDRISKIRYEVEPCRRLIQQIDTLDITLDESQFCSLCCGDIQEPKLELIIRHPGQTESHRVWDIDLEDLRMIQAVTEGHLQFENRMGWGEPLKSHLERLEELLGVELGEENIEEGEE